MASGMQTELYVTAARLEEASTLKLLTITSLSQYVLNANCKLPVIPN